MKKKIEMRQSPNFKAEQYKEFSKMTSIVVNKEVGKRMMNGQEYSDREITLTDFIFHEDSKLKVIKSGLSKDELKKVMNELIDKYYEAYEG